MYNYLNLPKSIGSISYLYDAAGNKLQKTFGNFNSYYQGSVLKITDPANTIQTIVQTGEGRAVKYGNENWAYEYDLKDHLGNTRISFGIALKSASPLQYKANPLQVKDYYPFGMEMANHSSSSTATKYLYNGKELQDEDGLDFYDYGARFYDPVVGRWHSVDLASELFISKSPYSYCMNNPLKYIDANGLWPTKKVADNGSVGNRSFSLVPVMNPYHKVSRPHKGQDFPVPEGNNIHALAKGKVSNIGYDKYGWGYFVDINHSDGYTTRYAHLQKGGINVKNGDEITDGEIIALSGMTGGATGPHLHLELLLNGKHINPMSISDLQLFLDELNSVAEETVNEDNPIELKGITVTAKGRSAIQSIKAQVKVEYIEYNSENAYGNTGKYNKPGRSTDQYYSDDFLKWYYGNNNKE